MTNPPLQSDENFTEIKKSYEGLIQNIFSELESYKEEQSKIKEQLLNIIDYNTQASKNNIIASAPGGETAREHQQLTNDAISNLKQQVHHLNEERSTIKLLWKTSQDTIVNLETEIQNYRNQLFRPSAFAELKQKYSGSIKVLENVITNQKNEISKQASTIRDLVDERRRSSDRIKELQTVILEQDKRLSEGQLLEKTNANLKQKLQTVLNTNSELEISTTLAKSMIDERFIRERNALEKLQEALYIAEVAVAEKEDALKRELVIKEECETLATTIGQVMEEAARKVERNVECLKLQYAENEKILSRKHHEALVEVENQRRVTYTAQARCRDLEQKLKNVLNENHKLDNDLQMASQAIIEMELKVEATENLLKEDKRSDRICEEREQQIRQYIDDNQQLKERWKRTIEDVTKKFGYEIQRLQKENSNLKAEIQSERLKVYKLGY